MKDLLPDYYLGNLSPEEADRVASELESDAELQRELDEVARVLDLMPFALRPETPPPDLKRRVLQRVLEEDADRGADDGAAPLAPVRPIGRLTTWVGTFAAAAAVLVVSLVGFAYWDLRQENRELQADVQALSAGGNEELLVVAVSGTQRAPEARGTAVVNAANGGLALDVYNLPAAPEGHSYQAWLVQDGGGSVPLGRMKTDGRGDGRMAGQAPGPLAGYRAVEVTVEPTGADGKSGPAYLTASL